MDGRSLWLWLLAFVGAGVLAWLDQRPEPEPEPDALVEIEVLAE